MLYTIGEARREAEATYAALYRHVEWCMTCPRVLSRRGSARCPAGLVVWRAHLRAVGVLDAAERLRSRFARALWPAERRAARYVEDHQAEQRRRELEQERAELLDRLRAVDAALAPAPASSRSIAREEHRRREDRGDRSGGAGLLAEDRDDRVLDRGAAQRGVGDTHVPLDVGDHPVRAIRESRSQSARDLGEEQLAITVHRRESSSADDDRPRVRRIVLRRFGRWTAEPRRR